MSDNPYGNASIGHQDAWVVADSSPQARTDFIHKTYQHLALAIAAFVGVEALLLNIPGIENVILPVLSSRFGWLAVLGVFMFVSHIATKWAHGAVSPEKQYLGLGVYVVAEALIFLPLLYIAASYAGADVIIKSAVVTGVVFGGLTATVLITKKDFGFLRGILTVAGFGALGIIVVSLVFGFSLGTWFSGAMVVFAAGAIVYQTSNILHEYQPGQHVAAALGLFASVALLFWYVLQLFMSSRD